MNLPKRTPTPFSSLHLLGRGLILSQLFESDMVRVMTTYERMSGKMADTEKLEAEWQKRAKLTLGQVLKNYGHKWPTTRGFLGTLQAAIDSQNWIVHRSFKENSTQLHSREGEMEFIGIFMEHYAAVFKGYELILVIEDAICAKIGYSKDQRLADYLIDTAHLMKYRPAK